MRDLINLFESYTPESPAGQCIDAFCEQLEASGAEKYIHVSLHQHADDRVEISRIETVEAQRGRGFGNHAMGILTDCADRFGVTLMAGPATDADETNGEDGMGYQDLHDWYERWDFKGGSMMYRRPFTE